MPIELPGAVISDPELVARLKKAKTAAPRTAHVNAQGEPLFTNRLLLENSPYLLQHAHNPVNWYPWGKEAFRDAQSLQRPVLLSVGYSTCHWCHVMEEESFENLDIANYMNRHYIAIKVDREELPDVDSLYMLAVQAMTGGGGWPLTVWLDDERKPFFGGTYFPPGNVETPGFLPLLQKLQQLYATEPAKVKEQSRTIAQHIATIQARKTGDSEVPSLTATRLEVLRYYRKRYDRTWGGLSGAPKFPSSLSLPFLLHCYHRDGDAEVLEMVTTTLDKMADGGIYDHVGGGFHRYSVDAQWQVPHFEKMLYDNALLAESYLDAFVLTGKERYKEVTLDILRYLLTDMRSTDGGFYAATDADSPNAEGVREEGHYFTFTPAELQEWGTGFPPLGDRCVLTREGKNFALDTVREKLQPLRAHKSPPDRDEKIITAWNSMAISAYAKAGDRLAEPDLIAVAEKTAAFVRHNLYAGDTLYRVYRGDVARHRAFLDDYAFYIKALLDLHAVTHTDSYLTLALQLDRELHEHYEDKDKGGFFISAASADQGLWVREKPVYDGAEPGANSVTYANLVRLATLTGDPTFQMRSARLLRCFAGLLKEHPVAFSYLLVHAEQSGCELPSGCTN